MEHVSNQDFLMQNFWFLNSNTGFCLQLYGINLLDKIFLYCTFVIVVLLLWLKMLTFWQNWPLLSMLQKWVNLPWITIHKYEQTKCTYQDSKSKLLATGPIKSKPKNVLFQVWKIKYQLGLEMDIENPGVESQI